jgi:hypothetical protein
MSPDPKLIHNANELFDELSKAETLGARPCTCSLKRCEGWDTINDSTWPRAQLLPIGTLRDSSIDEPTFEEFEPNGLRVDDPQALISPPHYPYNRCDVFVCTLCNQGVMRYTEYGGYYIDHRARIVKAVQIIKE